MSIHSSINIHIQAYECFDIVESLLEAGWTLNDHGYITYTLISDDFIPVQICWINNIEGLEHLKKVVTSAPLQTLCITWKDTNIGCTIIFHNANSIGFLLNINRQDILLSNARITDYNWYIERLFMAFSKKDIINISWEQDGMYRIK